MRQELDGSLEFGYLSDKPEVPVSPIPPEDEILLNSRDDQGLHGPSHFSFSLDGNNAHFNVPSVVESDWSHRVGYQTDASLPLHPNGFFELAVPPGTNQHLSAKLHGPLHGTSPASSTTSNSFVHLTPQGSSGPSHTQQAGSGGVISLASESAGRCSPRESTPGSRSQDNSHNSPPVDPLGSRPCVGPSRAWELRPIVSNVPTFSSAGFPYSEKWANLDVFSPKEAGSPQGIAINRPHQQRVVRLAGRKTFPSPKDHGLCLQLRDKILGPSGHWEVLVGRATTRSAR